VSALHLQGEERNPREGSENRVRAASAELPLCCSCADPTTHKNALGRRINRLECCPFPLTAPRERDGAESDPSSLQAERAVPRGGILAAPLKMDDSCTHLPTRARPPPPAASGSTRESGRRKDRWIAEASSSVACGGQRAKGGGSSITRSTNCCRLSFERKQLLESRRSETSLPPCQDQLSKPCNPHSSLGSS
jgi:hypothetical protein